ncbi:hypothetical protein ACJ73_07789 [Blastomyces percursus]|uniref:Uncharacterized protein n=1 Tax=Blastomyces percursus TaxID=1658174 RepID=A0A1J9PWZ7_9EURO|nr:hypothetical protein ACJ73_07789 [Blastomyces percursus]
MQRVKSLVHREPQESGKSASHIQRARSRRVSDAVLAGQGSHLADIRSSVALEKVQPRYPDEEAAFLPRPSSPEPHHRRTDSGVAGLESSQQESKALVNGRPTGPTAIGTSRGQNSPLLKANMRSQERSTMPMSGGVATGQKQQMGTRKVGVPDEKEAAASAAASAYFRRRPNVPGETMRSGKAVHSLKKSQEPPISAWGKGRECRPLAHDPLAGVPRRDSGTYFASPASTPSRAPNNGPPRVAQPEPSAAETGQTEKTEYEPKGYSGMMEEPGREEPERQYERPLGPEALVEEKTYEVPITEGQGMPQGEGRPRETELERLTGEGLEVPSEAHMQPTAVGPPQSARVAQPDVTAEEIAAREEATRRAVIEETTAKRKAAEEVAAREAVTRESVTRENIARKTAQEEIASMEQATREAYARENAARESAEAELAALEEATRQAAAREAAARDAAAATIQSTEAATREAVANESLAKQIVAEKISTKEAVTREAVAREAAAREAANMEAAIKHANTREIAAEEVAVREAALRKGGFDEAIARDAALREVAAEEVAVMHAEGGEGFMQQEPGPGDILVREPDPGSVAAGGGFAEGLPPEQMATGGASTSAIPAGTGAPAGPVAVPVNQPSSAEQNLGAQVEEQRQGVGPLTGRRPSKEEKELEKQRTKEERKLEKQRTKEERKLKEQKAKEEKDLQKQRTKQEQKLNKERYREEKSHQAQLKKEQKETERQHAKSQKQLKKSRKKQEKEGNRQGQQDNSLLSKIRRSIGGERPVNYGIEQTVPDGAPAART